MCLIWPTRQIRVTLYTMKSTQAAVVARGGTSCPARGRRTNAEYSIHLVQVRFSSVRTQCSRLTSPAEIAKPVVAVPAATRAEKSIEKQQQLTRSAEASHDTFSQERAASQAALERALKSPPKVQRQQRPGRPTNDMRSANVNKLGHMAEKDINRFLGNKWAKFASATYMRTKYVH